MKRIISILMTPFLLFLLIPSQLKADENINQTATPVINTSESDHVIALTERLYEIRAMDIPAMSSAERKELRKEVRSIKSELKAITKSNSDSPAESAANKQGGGGIYLSAGSIIIVVLLLILLL